MYDLLFSPAAERYLKRLRGKPLSFDLNSQSLDAALDVLIVR